MIERDMNMAEPDTLDLASALTIAWLSNPNTRASADDVPIFLLSMYGAVTSLALPQPLAASHEAASHDYTPAVSVRKSLASPDVIISMIDGKPYRSLGRHLSSRGLTPDLYRDRYNLKPDYPMVAPGYSEARRATAKRIGLGRKPAEMVKAAEEKVVKRVRKGIAAAKQAAKAHLGTAE